MPRRVHNLVMLNLGLSGCFVCSDNGSQIVAVNDERALIFVSLMWSSMVAVGYAATRDCVFVALHPIADPPQYVIRPLCDEATELFSVDCSFNPPCDTAIPVLASTFAVAIAAPTTAISVRDVVASLCQAVPPSFAFVSSHNDNHSCTVLYSSSQASAPLQPLVPIAEAPLVVAYPTIQHATTVYVLYARSPTKSHITMKLVYDLAAACKSCNATNLTLQRFPDVDVVGCESIDVAQELLGLLAQLFSSAHEDVRVIDAFPFSSNALNLGKRNKI